MEELKILDILITTGGSILIGLMIGALARYLFRVLAFLIGVYIAILVYFNYISIISIEWSKIQEISETILDSVRALGVPDGVKDQQVFESFGLLGGFAIGFVIGIRFA